MKEKNASCAFCAYKKIDENSKEIFHPTRIMKEVRIKDMRVMNRIGCLTGLYDTTKYGKVYLHEDLISLRDDYAYWYDVISRTGISYGNPEVLAKYRVMSGTTTGKSQNLLEYSIIFIGTIFMNLELRRLLTLYDGRLLVLLNSAERY